MGRENRHTVKTLGLTTDKICVDEWLHRSRIREPKFSVRNRSRKQRKQEANTRVGYKDEPTRMGFDYDVPASRRISAESRKKPRPSASGIAPKAAATQAAGSTLAISA